MELAANLRRVGNDIVACYLVADGTGVTLVDAGLAGQWDEFLAELAAMGHSPADVKAVLLTHGDEDHIGFAERLRREHGIPVWVHEADAGRARGEGKPPTGWGHVRPAALFRLLADAARKGSVALLLHARDAAVDGSRKLDQALRVGLGLEGSAEQGLVVPASRAILSMALGRENVVHIALIAPAAAARVAHALDRWRGFMGRNGPETGRGDDPCETDSQAAVGASDCLE